MTRLLPVLAAALLAGCTNGAPTAAPPSPTPSPPSDAVRARPVPGALVAYGSCPRLRQAVRREAVADATPYGISSLPQRGFDGVMRAAPTAALADSGAKSAPQAFSTTNNQEADVDEPDLVKTDGHLLLVVQRVPPAVRVVDVDGDAPRLVASLALPSTLQNPQVLLMGARAVVLGSEYTQSRTTSVARVVDLTDPAHPEVERTFTVDGSVVDARMVADRVLLAVQTTPDVPVVYPRSPSPSDTRHGLLVNRHAAATATAEDFLPTVTTSGGGSYRSDCSKALHPAVRSGLGTTTLVTLDPTRDAPRQTLTVVGSTTSLYASAEALYLATSPWTSDGRAARTDVHGFDISDPDHLSQLGTGSVEGHLLDEYALSAAHGDLRVASTVGFGPQADSRVTVLRPRAGALQPVGLVKGLGKGEQIRGVRFLGDLGYVVTFRQTDPLYVVDVSDGTRPRLRGELELTGFSSTLYPLDEGRLLGVGQDADPSTGRQLGLQLSAFDITSPDAPRLEHKAVLPETSSLAEQEQHALLWWEPARLVVLPFNRYDGQVGVVAFRVGAGGQLTEVARIMRPGTTSGDPSLMKMAPPSQRALVIGDLLYSVHDDGLVTSPLDELSAQAWTPFP